LFIAWLEHETQDYSLEWAVGLATRLDVKECLPAVRRIVRKGPQSVLCTAMVALKKFGGKDDIKELDKYLKDATVVGGTLTVDSRPGKEFSVHLGDIALGVSVILAGDTLRDYGFESPGGFLDETAYRFAFTSNTARQAAREKWRARSEKDGK